MLPEFHDCLPAVALEAERESGVVECHTESFGGVGRRAGRLARKQCLRVAEDPRIAERAAADHDAGTAGVVTHAHDVLRRADVAVADDRDIECLDDARDLVPVGPAGKHLGTRPRMQRERAGARVLHPQGDADRIARVLAPPASGLDRHGQMRGPDDRADDAIDEPEVAQASGPAVPLHDFLHRTTEVDIDELGSVVLGDQGSRLGHRSRIGAVDLDGDGPLALLEFGPLEGVADAAADRLAGQELGHDDVGAHRPADLPERGLRHPGHRSQDERERVRRREGQLHGSKILAACGSGNG
jgi:hypothetical protein